MGRNTVVAALVLTGIAVVLAIALPELFTTITGLQAASTGVSAPISGLLGSIPVVLFVLAAAVFTAVLVVAAKR